MITINGTEHWNHRGISVLAGAAPNLMLKWLRKNGYLNAQNLPVPNEHTRGWFTVKQAMRFNTRTTYWTETGMREILPVIRSAVESGEIPKARKKYARRYSPGEDQHIREFWDNNEL